MLRLVDRRPAGRLHTSLHTAGVRLYAPGRRFVAAGRRVSLSPISCISLMPPGDRLIEERESAPVASRWYRGRPSVAGGAPAGQVQGPVWRREGRYRVSAAPGRDKPRVVTKPPRHPLTQHTAQCTLHSAAVQQCNTGPAVSPWSLRPLIQGPPSRGLWLSLGFL